MKQSPSTELELRQAQKMAAVPKHPHPNKQHGRHAANLSEHAEWRGFSVDNIDPTADPRQDFYRFAAGRCLDKAVIPDTDAQVGGFIGLFHRVNDQILALLQDAANSAGEAPGSIAQQVGIFFRRGDGYRVPGCAGFCALAAGTGSSGSGSGFFGVNGRYRPPHSDDWLAHPARHGRHARQKTKRPQYLFRKFPFDEQLIDQ